MNKGRCVNGPWVGRKLEHSGLQLVVAERPKMSVIAGAAYGASAATVESTGAYIWVEDRWVWKAKGESPVLMCTHPDYKHYRIMGQCSLSVPPYARKPETCAITCVTPDSMIYPFDSEIYDLCFRVIGEVVEDTGVFACIADDDMFMLALQDTRVDAANVGDLLSKKDRAIVEGIRPSGKNPSCTCAGSQICDVCALISVLDRVAPSHE